MGGLQVKIVSVHVLTVHCLLQFLQFMSVGLCQFTLEGLLVLKSFLGGGRSPSEYTVCPRPLCLFYFSFMPVYVGQDGLSSTLVYVN